MESDLEHDSKAMNRGGSPYPMLAINLLISGIIMYFVMFTMIDGLLDFYHNLNMLYMTLMMVAPMAILMILMMRSMYRNRIANIAIGLGFAVIFAVAFLFIRQQTTIGDIQFLRSMIPHHSGAILMCREAQLSDAEIQSLCQRIIQSQRDEIVQMKQILSRKRG
jgi:DUF305 family protein family protein